MIINKFLPKIYVGLIALISLGVLVSSANFAQAQATLIQARCWISVNGNTSEGQSNSPPQSLIYSRQTRDEITGISWGAEAYNSRHSDPIYSYSWSSGWGGAGVTSDSDLDYYTALIDQEGVYRATVTVTATYVDGSPTETNTCYGEVIVNPPLPVVISNFSPSPNPVDDDTASTISWNVANATACVGVFGDSRWAGPQSSGSGLYITDDLIADTDFKLECTGEGEPDEATITINVTPPPPPSITEFRAVPNPVISGEETSLKYTFSGATSCFGDWGFDWDNGTTVGGDAGSYEETLTSEKTYILTCNRIRASTSRVVEYDVKITACSDGKDNDSPSDGLVDFEGGPNGELPDPGCTSRADTTEYNTPPPTCGYTPWTPYPCTAGQEQTRVVDSPPSSNCIPPSNPEISQTCDSSTGGLPGPGDACNFGSPCQSGLTCQSGVCALPGAGIPTTGPGDGISNPLKADDVNGFIAIVLGTLVQILIPLIILFYVITGLMFITARGNPQKLAIAKKGLLYATIGAAIVLSAWVLAEVISNTISAVRE